VAIHKLEGSLSTRYPSLVLMYEKLVELGFVYIDGEIEYFGELNDV